MPGGLWESVVDLFAKCFPCLRPHRPQQPTLTFDYDEIDRIQVEYADGLVRRVSSHVQPSRSRSSGSSFPSRMLSPTQSTSQLTQQHHQQLLAQQQQQQPLLYTSGSTGHLARNPQSASWSSHNGDALLEAAHAGTGPRSEYSESHVSSTRISTFPAATGSERTALLEHQTLGGYVDGENGIGTYDHEGANDALRLRRASLWRRVVRWMQTSFINNNTNPSEDDGDGSEDEYDAPHGEYLPSVDESTVLDNYSVDPAFKRHSRQLSQPLTGEPALFTMERPPSFLLSDGVAIEFDEPSALVIQIGGSSSGTSTSGRETGGINVVTPRNETQRVESPIPTPVQTENTLPLVGTSPVRRPQLGFVNSSSTLHNEIIPDSPQLSVASSSTRNQTRILSALQESESSNKTVVSSQSPVKDSTEQE